MLKAAGQCMDLQSLRPRGSFLPPRGDFRDPYRRYQILLQRGQHGIGTDLSLRITAVIITAGESQAGDGDKEKGQTRPLHRMCSFDSVHHVLTPTRRRDTRARSAQAVNSRIATTSAESVRPVGTTAVKPSRL